MEPHLSENDILRLLDRTAEDAAQLYSHLDECDDCLADFKFMARSRMSSYDGRLTSEARDRLIDAGMAVPERVQKQIDPGGRPLRPSPPRGGRARIGRIVAVAAVLVVVAAAAWFWRASVTDPRIGVDITDPVRAAMISFSNSGPLTVIPGAERDLVTVNTTYRSGHAVTDEATLAAVYALSEYDQNADGSRELYFWKSAAYLATGQFHTARNVARAGSNRFPADAEIGVMLALAEYYNNDLDNAERRLREVLEIHPDYAVAEINLGIVLFENGGPGEAREVFARVGERFPSTPLADRAQELKERIP